MAAASRQDSATECLAGIRSGMGPAAGRQPLQSVPQRADLPAPPPRSQQRPYQLQLLIATPEGTEAPARKEGEPNWPGWKPERSPCAGCSFFLVVLHRPSSHGFSLFGAQVQRGGPNRMPASWIMQAVLSAVTEIETRLPGTPMSWRWLPALFSSSPACRSTVSAAPSAGEVVLHPRIRSQSATDGGREGVTTDQPMFRIAGDRVDRFFDLKARAMALRVEASPMGSQW